MFFSVKINISTTGGFRVGFLSQALLSTLSTALIRCPLPYYLSLYCRRCWMSNYWFIAKFQCFWLIAPLPKACIAQSIEIGHRVEIVDSLIIIHHFYCYYYSLLLKLDTGKECEFIFWQLRFLEHSYQVAPVVFCTCARHTFDFKTSRTKNTILSPY